MRTSYLASSLAVITLTFGAANTFAGAKKTPGTSGQGMKKIDQVRDVLDRLDLTADQKEKIRGAFSEARQKLIDAQAEAKVAKKKGGDKSAVQSKAKTIVRELTTELKAILTPDQFKQLRTELQKAKQEKKQDSKENKATTQPAL